MPESISGALVGAQRPADAHTDELDRVIEQRAKAAATERDRANAEEESWKQSTRIYNGELREMRRHQWISYYRTLARNLRTSAERFEDKADELQEVKA